MTIFIRNLPRHWRRNALDDYLSKLGIMATRCMVPGVRRGFGLVEIEDQHQAWRVIVLLNAQMLQGQRLVAMPSTHPIVEHAEGSFDKKPQPSRPRKRKQREKNHRRGVVEFKPTRADRAWPPVGVAAL